MSFALSFGISHVYEYLNQPPKELRDISKLPPAIVKKIYTGFNLAEISVSRLVCNRWRDRFDSDRMNTCLWHPMIFNAYVRNNEHGEKVVTEKDLPSNTMKTIRNSSLLFKRKLGTTNDIIITQLKSDNKVYTRVMFKPVNARLT